MHSILPGTKFRQWSSLKHILSVPLSATTKSSSLVYSSNFNFHSNRQFNNIWTSSKNVSFYITLLCKKSLKETASFGLCAVILGRRRRLTFLATGYSTLVTTVKEKQDNWLLSWMPITAVGKNNASNSLQSWKSPGWGGTITGQWSVSAVVRPDPNQLNVGQRACLCGTVWEMLLIL